MLSVLIWIPIIGAILMICLPPTLAATRYRYIALAIAVGMFIWSVILASQFDFANGAQQFTESLAWIPQLGLNYNLGLDGLSLPLVVLNNLLTGISIFSTKDSINRPRFYYALLLFLNGAVAGAFVAENFLLFFLFYELELFPLYLLIAIWGGVRRSYAAIKFLIYTALSGVLILLGCFGIGWLGTSFGFDYANLVNHGLPLGQQVILLSMILIGFGIKIPLFPFHTWLPDAHVEASTPVSVLLAGVLLKIGTYGLLRFGLGIFPDAWQVLAPFLAGWAVVSVLYGALTAIAQTDMKKMVAYSSIAHMGYILLAMAAATKLSLLGAMMQMVSHGLISATLFLLVGVVYAKAGTRDLTVLRGLLNPERGMPITGSLMILAVMASAGTPGMAGFIAEFVIFRGSFVVFPVQTLLCMLGTGLTAVYFLLLVNRAFFGRLSPVAESLPVVNWRDRTPALILTAFIILFGLQPSWLTSWSESAIAALPAATPVPTAALIQSQ